MTKKVEPIEVKLYFKYLDAVEDMNYVIWTIDVEDNHYPDSVDIDLGLVPLPDKYKSLSGEHSFRVKPMSRRREDRTQFIEAIYLLIS